MSSLLQGLYRAVARPVLFGLDAERAHGLATAYLHAAHGSPLLRGTLRGGAPDACLRVRAFGLDFCSPIGLAAGFDKGASMYNALGALGFASVEVGTVTALAQPGNERPRLFRLREDRALVNRMGFNNAGAEAVARALAAHPPDAGLVLGVNLGKSKVTELEQAPEDYAQSARLLGPYAHYVVVNVSSPNTPGLRSLQSVEALRPVLRAVCASLGEACAKAPPVLVKIAPDLSDDDVDAVTDLAGELGLAGVIATNTTVAREGLGLRTSPREIARVGAGGLSGAPLRARSLAVVRRVYERAGGGAGKLVVVGAGGIASAAHAWEAIGAGATLVQLYTAFVYEGPEIARRIAHGLAQRVRAAGVASVGDAVGRGLPDPLLESPPASATRPGPRRA